MVSTTALTGVSSSASSSSAASTSAAAACNLYEIPIAEPGCAVSFSDAHRDAMAACCGAAEVVSYFSDCGLYCAAAGQTIKDLQDCLFGGRPPVAYQDVFCNAPNNASATNTRPDIPATASASVVAGGNDDDDDDDDKDGNDDDNSPEPSDSGSAAPRLAPEMCVSKTGLTIGALLFSAMAFGAFQV
ncbi:hypothetical protein F4802DRAFT_442946 [Xylaria palmicola]|nr:hypothetical protein F4802DRAFT_442946 [Xylaria palmicola]